MSKGKVLHHQRVITRVLRAAKATAYPVETIEFTADGSIIMKPRNREDVFPGTGDDEQSWDKAIHAADEKRTT